MVDCSDEIVPALTNVVNESLLSGTFPTVFKHAIVKPLLKKPSLGPNDLKNFRPVSNLSFFSKLLEKVVTSQLLDYFNTKLMNFGLGFNLLIVLVTPLKPLYLES